VAAARPASPRRWPLIVAALVLLAGLIAVGVAALIRITTEQGTYVIETDDPELSFQVGNATVFLEDRKANRKYTLKVLHQDKQTGKNELEVIEPAADLQGIDVSDARQEGERTVKHRGEVSGGRRPGDGTGNTGGQGERPDAVAGIARAAHPPL
jgi:hypothetical protein